MKKLFIFILLLTITSIFGQGIEWIKTYHNNIESGAWDIGYKVFETGPDEYLVAATTFWHEYSPFVEHYPFYFIKVNSVGDTIWTRMYGDDAEGIIALREPDGNIIDFNGHNLIKINPETGDSIGESNLLPDSLYDSLLYPWFFILTSDSCLLVTYYLENPWGDSICDSMFIIKMDLDFDTIWNRSYYNNFDYGADCIEPCADGGFIIGGERGSAYVEKFNSDGDLLWSRTYDSSYTVYCIEETNGNRYILGGVLYANTYIWEIDSLGNVLWTNWFSFSEINKPNHITNTLDSGFIICGDIGWEGVHPDSTDGLIFKIDSLGNLEWSKQVDVAEEGDHFYDVIQTSDSGYLCTGTSSIRCDTCPYSPDTFDICLVKFSKDGEVVWENRTKLPDNINISAYPNPFNSSVKIIVSDGRGLACQTLSNIKVYDLRGNLVGTPYPAGAGFVPLNKGDRNRASAKVSGGSSSAQGIFIWQPDKSVASGIYIVKVTIGNHTIVRRIALIR